MDRIRRIAGSGVAAAVLAVALTACLGSGDDSGQESDGGTATSQESGDGGSAVDTSQTIAEATFNASIAEGAKVEIGIVELTVSGKLARLVLTITPQVPGADEVSFHDLVEGDPGAALIDTENLKRHVVVKDSGGNRLQPGYIITELQNGQAHEQTYWFAAPAAQKVDVQFGPWPPFRNVPASR